jgi:hypothetical protein
MCASPLIRLRFVFAALTIFLPSLMYSQTQLLPGTNVLLSQGGGGNGGNTSSTSSSTNIFSPATYADYKRFGGEPTTTVDRFLLTGSQAMTQCATGQTQCFRDFVYGSSPQGFVEPHYSTFFKSSDLGQSFRTTQHFPATDLETFNAGGGGDSYIAIGQVSHKVFFTDLPADCVTLNVSSDFGETFTPGPQACGTTPGAVDDRNWVAVDELFPGDAPPTTGHVYVSFINFSTQVAPTLEAQVSTADGNDATLTFAASTCNAATLATGSGPTSIAGAVQAPDATATPCPDPADSFLAVAGPPVVDIYNTHNIYIPFIRNTPVIPGVSSGPPFSLLIARSTDGGKNWTRIKVADTGVHDPANIFPQLTIDKSGNLYYTWSQTQGPSEAAPALGGEQDVYYAFSTTHGSTWSQPIDLTGEVGDSAIFPWMVAGDAGQVDIVFYKANTGLNSNVAAVDASGNPSSCTPDGSTCFANPSVWNVYFGQSQNALNTGPNFKTVQISSEPNHLGQICTGGLGCSTGGNRNLLDFFTVDVDHLGAANVTWADDNNARPDTINRFSRQISGNSVFKNTNISLQSSWPITNHAVTDIAGDVYNGSGAPVGSCAGMDLLGTSEQQSNGLITITVTLNNAPTAAEAAACSVPTATGGIWGAEFWSSSPDGNNNFYIAYRDVPGDRTGPEAGRVNDVNATVTSLELDRDNTVPASLGGTCFTSSGSPTATAPCTVSITAAASALGIKPGAGIYSITGLSLYFFGTDQKPPLLRTEGGNSEQADAATPFDDNGTGTTK